MFKFIKQLFLAILATALLIPAANAAPVLWVGDGSGTLGTVDVDTGSVNVIGSMGRIMTDIAFDASGNLWGITFRGLYSIDKATATSTLVGAFRGPNNLNSLVFGSDGTLYAAGANNLHSLNTATGVASHIGSSRYNSSGDLAFVGGELFLSSSFGGDSLVKLNTFDGSGASVGNIGSSAVFGLASPDGINLYGLAETSILSINTATGLGTFIRDYSGNGLGQAFGSAFISEVTPAVPVPAALFMFAPALLGFFGLRRKTKNAVA